MLDWLISKLTELKSKLLFKGFLDETGEKDKWAEFIICICVCSCVCVYVFLKMETTINHIWILYFAGLRKCQCGVWNGYNMFIPHNKSTDFYPLSNIESVL